MAMAPVTRRIGDEIARRPLLLRVLALLALSCLCFYVGKRWASRYEQVVVYSSTSPLLPSSSEGHVSLVKDYGEQEEERSDRSAGFNHSAESSTNVSVGPSFSPAGILQDDGAIFTTNFPIEEDLSTEDESLDSGGLNTTGFITDSNTRQKYKFEVCPASMKEYIPCLDNVAAVKRLPSTRRGEHWERHCPSEKRARSCCLIAAPAGYRFPIRWPKSRNEVWYNNVPHTRLVEDKGGQNWIAIQKDKFVFPGGGTQFAHGANQYLDQMEKMVPDIAFGVRTRVALDIGCGVASWGAYVMSRNVLPLSIAPKDVHENQIQFALERGVPAMVAGLATRRLLYPSQAFELIHCSRCRIEWTGYGGLLLLEVNRLLRAGGFFAWAAQPVYKHEGNLPEEWHAMAELTERICWKLVAKQGYLAIWQKPFDNACYNNRSAESEPPLCGSENDPDDVWYAPMSACITPLPLDQTQKNISDWPGRLHVSPQRLLALRNDAKMAKEEAFIAEERYWNEIVTGYLRGLGLKREEVRNVMDMNAGYGGFAAAIVASKADWWVMNIVPVNSVNTLPIIYDRGLIGVAHDWCEPFDTYPRTYDLLHAAGLFTLEESRCGIARIVVEMDRMLRPGGWVLVRDSLDMIKKVEALARAARWGTRLLETESGPYGKDRLLSCKKSLWHA